MTRAERLKLAKAARELAGEYAEGRGPELEMWSWCGCAAGQVFRRAGIDNPDGKEAAAIDMDFGCILTGATARHLGKHYDPLPGAVVFPLLALADELESAP
jgi:hypothetical protein